MQSRDGYAYADSAGALKYYYWRNTLTQRMRRAAYNALVGKVDDYVDVFGWGKPAAPVTEAEQKELLEELLDGHVKSQVELKGPKKQGAVKGLPESGL